MKKTTIISASLFAALFLLPAMAFAQSLGNIDNILQSVLRILQSTLLPIVAALALIYFFWGLAKFILSAGDEEARKQGQRIMLWGVVALFVMVSVWGIVRFIGNAIGIGTDSSVPIPQAPGRF